MTSHSLSNRPDNQINLTRHPSSSAARRQSYDRGEHVPYPTLGQLLVDARKAAARGDKVECDRLWALINERRAACRST